MHQIERASFLLIIFVQYSTSNVTPPTPALSDWKLVGKSCFEGASSELLQKFCMVGDVVVDRSLCPDEPDKKGLLCTTKVPGTAGIVHGEIVQQNTRWPWQVFIELDGGANQCGGTLIAKEWILTAAHCLDDGRSITSLILGTTKKSGKDLSAVVTRPIRVCCHKDYDLLTLDNDICLIQVDFIVLHHIRPVLLPEQNEEVENGTICFITGWGYDENQNLPEDLQEAKVAIVERETCEEWHNQKGITVVNNTICAGHESGGADTCGGDSGGPLVCQTSGEDYYLYGVTSYGPTYCGSAKAPGIYTKVTHFRQWIDETIANPCPRTNWASWVEECSVTCGRGILRRTRMCMDEDGKDINKENCRGSSLAISFCVLDPCPTYSWGDWKIGPCSVTCGEGERVEERDCIENNNKTVSFENCGDVNTRRTNCSEQNCPDSGFRWSNWISGACSVTCGRGTKNERRGCINDENIVAPADVCGGVFERSVDCLLSPCPEYQWSSWTAYCSTTCGDGQETRLRNCQDNEANNVSPFLCEGHAMEQGTCNLKDCPRVGGDYQWGEWSSRCSVTCGQGFGIRERQCLDRFGRSVQVSLCGSGSSNEIGVGRCSLPPCQEDSTFYTWGPWTQWSTCRRRSNSFNRCTGFHSATRQCLLGGSDVDPYLCTTVIGGDSYKEENCWIIGC